MTSSHLCNIGVARHPVEEAEGLYFIYCLFDDAVSSSGKNIE
jgi:hypothetical protein